jgi:23S rRNA U2552 (ribose-2'-O)-methylase RlmE/FtsJ
MSNKINVVDLARQITAESDDAVPNSAMIGLRLAETLAPTGNEHEDSINNIMKHAPEVAEKLVQGKIAEANARARPKKTKYDVDMEERLSADEQKYLSDVYGEYKLKFDRANDTNSHYQGRANRRMERAHSLTILNYNPFCVPVDSDVVLKDYNGRCDYHIKRNNPHVHVCNPILSNRDSERIAASNDVLSNMRFNRPNKKTARMIADYQTNGKYRCNMPAGQCTVTASRLRFMNDALDLGLDNICKAMIVARASKAVAVIPFSVRLLTEREGVLPFTNQHFRKRGSPQGVMIDMFFEGDCQSSYTHSYDNLYSMATLPRASVTIAGLSYHFHIQRQVRGPSMYLTFLRAMNDVPETFCRLYLSDPTAEKMFRIVCWEYLPNQPSNIAYLFPLSKMKPVIITVPASIYYHIQTFAYALQGDNFNSDKIATVGQSMNSRISSGGHTFYNKNPIEPKDMYTLTSEIFISCYQHRFNTSRSIKLQIDDINAMRSKADSCFLYKIALRVLQSMRMSQPDISLAEAEALASPLIDIFGNGFKDVIKSGLKYPSGLCRHACPVIEVDTILPSITQKTDGSVAYYHNDFDLTNAFEHEVMQSLISGAEVQRYDPVPRVPQTVICDSEMAVVSNESNGACVIQSVIDSGALGEKSIVSICRELFSSRALAESVARDQLIKYVQQVEHELEITLWPTEEIFWVIAAHYGITVCLHKDDGCFRYGQSPTVIHIVVERVDNEHCHCRAARPIISMPNILELDTDTPVEIAIYDPAADSRLDLLRKENEKEFENALKVIRDIHDTAGGDTRGYICRAALKTIEMDRRYHLIAGDRAVSIGAPGGEAQYLLERCELVYGITKFAAKNFHQSLYENPRFVDEGGIEGTGDLLDDFNNSTICESIGYSSVSFVGCDAAVSEHDGHATNVALVVAECKISVQLLQPGGNCYVKVMSAEALASTLCMRRYFDRVFVVQLSTTLKYSDELHVVCINRNTTSWSPDGFAVKAVRCLQDIFTGTDEEWGEAIFAKLKPSRIKLLNQVYSIKRGRVPISVPPDKWLDTVSALEPVSASIKRGTRDHEDEISVHMPAVMSPASSVETLTTPSEVQHQLLALPSTEVTADEAVTEYMALSRNTHHVEVLRLYETLVKMRTYADGDPTLMHLPDDMALVHPYAGLRRIPRRHRNVYRCFAVLDKDDVLFIDYTKENIANNSAFGLVSEYCEHLTEHHICARYDNQLPARHDDFVWHGVQSPPGCGKTEMVLQTHVPNQDLVLMTTVEGLADFKRRLTSRDPRIKPSPNNYRTIASVLLNGSKQFDDLYIDEAGMQHYGALVLVVNIVRPKRVMVLGDFKQIAAIVKTYQMKTSTGQLYVAAYNNIWDHIPIRQVLEVSHRMPLDVTAALRPLYEEAYRSMGIRASLYSSSPIKRSVKLHDTSQRHLQTMRPSGRILTYTHLEKHDVEAMLHDVNPITIHSFQGQQAEEVSVCRTNFVPDSQIFLRPEYALVAISRHTHRFNYYTPLHVDALYHLCRKAIDVTPNQISDAFREDTCLPVGWLPSN